MGYLLLGTFLFSLTHPVGKVFLDLRLSVFSFCILFLSFRILAQIPLVWSAGQFAIKKRSHLWQLLGLGFVGASLHYAEFSSLNIGLSVPTASFLIFTHPIWTLLLRAIFFGDSLTWYRCGRVAAGLVGMFLMLGPEVNNLFSLQSLFFPLLASFGLAAWILLSHSSQESGVPMKQLSLYYDLFSLILLVALGAATRGQETIEGFRQLTPAIAGGLIVYSLVVGIIANYLFLIGIRRSGGLAASLVLLLEPVLSSVLGTILFDVHLTLPFFLGSLCILLANVPEPRIKTVPAVSRQPVVGGV